MYKIMNGKLEDPFKDIRAYQLNESASSVGRKNITPKKEPKKIGGKRKRTKNKKKNVNKK